MTGLRHKQLSGFRQGTGTYARIFISASRIHYSKFLTQSPLHACMHMRCCAWLLPIITSRTGITSVRGTFAQRRPLSSQLRMHKGIVAQPNGRKWRSRTAPLCSQLRLEIVGRRQAGRTSVGRRSCRGTAVAVHPAARCWTGIGTWPSGCHGRSWTARCKQLCRTGRNRR